MSDEHVTRQMVGAAAPDLLPLLVTARDFRRFYSVLTAQVRAVERARGEPGAQAFYFHSHEEILKKALALGVDFVLPSGAKVVDVRVRVRTTPPPTPFASRSAGG